MAIFGKTKVGGIANIQTVNFEEAYGFWLPEVGSPLSIWALLTGLAGGPQANRFVLRRSASPQLAGGVPKPGALLDTTNEIVIAQNAPQAWYEFPLKKAGLIDLQPGIYWLGVWSGANTNGASLAYDAVTNFAYFEAETYSSTNDPVATFSTTPTSANHEPSVYCEYTPRSGYAPRSMPKAV